MSSESTHAVTPIDGRKVESIGATVPQPHHERSSPNEAGATARPPVEPDAPAAAESVAGHRTTDLAYQMDAESKRRQKSPAVVGSGIARAPSKSRKAASLRRSSISSSTCPPHSRL